MVTDSVLMGLQVVGALAERVVFVVSARRHQLPQVLFHPFGAAIPYRALPVFEERGLLRPAFPVHHLPSHPEVLAQMIPIQNPDRPWEEPGGCFPDPRRAVSHHSHLPRRLPQLSQLVQQLSPQFFLRLPSFCYHSCDTLSSL